MAHPKQLIEALIRRLLDAKKANKGKPASERAFRTQYEKDYPYDDVGEMRNVVPTAAESEARTIAGPGRGDAFGTFVDDPKGVAVREARQEARGAQGRDPLEQPVESGLSRYLPEENIHEPMMPRTRDGSPRTRDRTRLPDSESNWDRRLRIADEEKTKRMRKGTHRDTKADNLRVMEDDFISAQKEFERLAGRPPSGEEMKDIGTLEKLVDLLKDASGSGKKVSRPTLADDIDDIPF